MFTWVSQVLKARSAVSGQSSPGPCCGEARDWWQLWGGLFSSHSSQEVRVYTTFPWARLSLSCQTKQFLYPVSSPISEVSSEDYLLELSVWETRQVWEEDLGEEVNYWTRDTGFWARCSWHQTQAMDLPTYIIWAMSLNSSESQFLHLQHGDNNSPSEVCCDIWNNNHECFIFIYYISGLVLATRER
jgi:hypothetical protein